MSIQYYYPASQQGDALADLALSKSFLVGSKFDPNDSNPPLEGFDKDEVLALVVGEKAASNGEAGSQFAMGYYREVGISREVDLNEAKCGISGRQSKDTKIQRLVRRSCRGRIPRLLGAQEHQGRVERMRRSERRRVGRLVGWWRWGCVSSQPPSGDMCSVRLERTSLRWRTTARGSIVLALVDVRNWRALKFPCGCRWSWPRSCQGARRKWTGSWYAGTGHFHLTPTSFFYRRRRGCGLWALHDVYSLVNAFNYVSA